MTFNLTSFVVLAGQGKRDEAFQMLGYISTDDKADVIASDYFNELRGKISVNDVIEVVNNSGDGENLSYRLRIESVSVTGVVEVEDITPTTSANDVTSVFGRTGAVVAVAGDYEASEVTNAFDVIADDTDSISEGTTNKFTSTTEINKLAGIEPGATVDQDISGIGTNATNIGTNTDDIALNTAKGTRTVLFTGSAGASTINLSEDINNFKFLEFKTTENLDNSYVYISVESFKESDVLNWIFHNMSTADTSRYLHYYYETDTSITIETAFGAATLTKVVGIK